MLKKTISILLAIALVGLLVACGGGRAATPAQGGAGAGGASPGGGEVMQLRLSHNQPDFSAYDNAARLFKELIEERSNGRFEITIFPNNQLGTQEEVTEAVMLGNIDLVVTSDDRLIAFANEWGALGMPFLFDDFDHVYAAVNGTAGAYLNDLIARSNMYVISWLENGFRHVTNDRGPIYTPEDIAGLRMRVLSSLPAMAFMDRAGASVLNISFSELYAALQLGAVNSQENPLHNIRERSFYEVQTYLSLIGYVHTVQPMLMSLRLLNSLSAEDQQLFREVGREVSTFAFQQAMADEDAHLAYLSNHMIINTVDRDAFADVVQAVWEEFGEEYGYVIEMIRAYAN